MDLFLPPQHLWEVQRLTVIFTSHRNRQSQPTHCVGSYPTLTLCPREEITSIHTDLQPYPNLIFSRARVICVYAHIAKIISTNEHVCSELNWRNNTLESAARRTVPSSLIKGCWIFTSIPGSRRPADLFKSTRHLTVRSPFNGRMSNNLCQN